MLASSRSGAPILYAHDNLRNPNAIPIGNGFGFLAFIQKTVM